jgi:hypothetical protein
MSTPTINLSPSINVPPEIYAAAETLHNFFAMEGHSEWQFMDVASRRVVTKLEQEKRDLVKQCIAFQKALNDLTKP